MPVVITTGSASSRVSSGEPDPTDLAATVRGLVWALGPVAPASRISGPHMITAHGSPGESVVMTLSIANQGQAVLPFTLEAGPLVSGSDVWCPEGSVHAVLRAGEEREVQLTVPLPADLAPGRYRGRLIALGTEGDPCRLEIQVGSPSPRRHRSAPGVGP